MNIQSAEFTREATSATPVAHCRLCGTRLNTTFVDLGMSPLCESFLRPSEARSRWSRTSRCTCWSATAASWCSSRSMSSPEHDLQRIRLLLVLLDAAGWRMRKRYCEMITSAARARARDSLVVELASNDGYLLQHFLPLGVPVLGIEPAANVAKVAIEKGVPTRVDFFGVRLAEQLVAEGVRADLIVGNNVLAQVPDLNDFVAGMTHPAQAGRRRHAGVPAHRAADRRRTSSTPSTTSTSRTSRCSPSSSMAAPPRPQGDRRRGAPDAWRLAACLSRPRRPARVRSRRPWPSCSAREKAAGLTEIATYRAFAASRCAAPSATCSPS